MTGGRPGSPAPGRVTIRAARGADLPRVREIEVASFSVPWGEGSFRSLLGLARVLFLVAEVDRGIVGHGILWWMADEGELANLAVHPAARGHGVAGALVDELLDRATKTGLDRVFLEVRASNRTALELYRSRGFREIGVRKGYYRRPREDARVLRLELGAYAHARDSARPHTSDDASADDHLRPGRP